MCTCSYYGKTIFKQSALLSSRETPDTATQSIIMVLCTAAVSSAQRCMNIFAILFFIMRLHGEQVCYLHQSL